MGSGAASEVFLTMTTKPSTNAPSDCLFCKIVSGTIPASRVYEDELCIGFPDINPQAPKHLLLFRSSTSLQPRRLWLKIVR